MTAWRPALRMARRDLRRHKVRALLTCLLVALPVVVATVAALAAHNGRWTNEVEAAQNFHDGNGLAVVSEHTEVRPRAALNGWPEPVRGADERDPASVDLAALLPAGTDVVPAPALSLTPLTTGGQGEVLRVDLSHPLTDDVVDITQGRAPAAPDEVAMSRAAAAEMGLLPGGRLSPDARFELAGGVTLDVVGIAEKNERDWGFYGPVLVAPPDSVAPVAGEPGGYVEPPSYLLGLPPLEDAQVRELVADLAAEGVALQPRVAVENPREWGLHQSMSDRLDLTPLLLGGLCILVGLIEVVLLVGAAFSVSARRQVRDLGLLATNGGAAPDVRRVLLAQGIVLGVVSSVIGAAIGVTAFLLGADVLEDRFGQTMHAREVPWWLVVVMAGLGSVTSVVAALLPGWRMARLTPVDALSGRFPLRPGESRAHRPAFVLAAGGVLLLAVGGWATAEAERSYPNWLGAAVFLAGSGLVALVAGTVWATPYAVRRAAGLGRFLPLSGRYAFRDAGRHRFRSAAAVMALTITVAATVLIGFAFASAERGGQFDDRLGPRILSVDVCCSVPDTERLDAIEQTIGSIVDPVETATTSTLGSPDGKGSLDLLRARDALTMVDEADLRMLVHLDDDDLAVFRNGGVLTTYAGVVRDGEVTVARFPGGRKSENQSVLPATQVKAVSGVTPYTQPSYVSAETAADLGVVASFTQLVVRTATPVTGDQLERLRIRGLWADSDDVDRAQVQLAQYAGIGAAGLLAAIVVGMAVALAAAESRDDVATLAAVGAAPWTRRRFGAMHGLFLGVVGTALGVGVGVAAGLAFAQIDGLPGADVPWLHLLGTVALVLPVSWLVGGIVTPSRFTLTRRTA
ncbi:FtsX-like permease family protein [Nocardioides seonyuensis]|uniref:FtsX-like permease family protein n=1 Tax=Nocardioides seonyuensis TaxID=2518371 RepID=A0A4P7IEA9_9ACTN|nr:FtsX-like permease family protein [Nocardioides seonyuensis]QBX55559.1 FtsX-like permease family protein [Nocardioides seonyuensis]